SPAPSGLVRPSLTLLQRRPCWSSCRRVVVAPLAGTVAWGRAERRRGAPAGGPDITRDARDPSEGPPTRCEKDRGAGTITMTEPDSRCLWPTEGAGLTRFGAPWFVFPLRSPPVAAAVRRPS